MQAKDIAPRDIVHVDSFEAVCDGAAPGAPGPLGHPRVYLSLAKTPATDCPYCGRRFERPATLDAGKAH